MKREIKFRAWDKRNKKMLKVAGVELISGREIVSVGTLLPDEVVYGKVNGSNLSLMQYTGIHDKNGREIYEGDIVHAYDQEPDRDEPDYRGSEATGIVEFNGSMFMLDDDIVLDYPPILEVIGNIFENTEMLEEEQ